MVTRFVLATVRAVVGWGVSACGPGLATLSLSLEPGFAFRRGAVELP
jgi:hypothetical protein